MIPRNSSVARRKHLLCSPASHAGRIPSGAYAIHLLKLLGMSRAAGVRRLAKVCLAMSHNKYAAAKFMFSKDKNVNSQAHVRFCQRHNAAQARGAYPRKDWRAMVALLRSFPRIQLPSVLMAVLEAS